MRSNLLARSFGSTVALLLIPVIVAADAESPPEDHLEARSRFVEALSSSNLETVHELIDENGLIVFGLGQSTAMSLGDWFEQFQAAIQSGVGVNVQDLESRSGGSGDTGWTWARQALSWTRSGETESFATATWNTTEVWERHEGIWKVVHVHHSNADSPDAKDDDDETED